LTTGDGAGDGDGDGVGEAVTGAGDGCFAGKLVTPPPELQAAIAAAATVPKIKTSEARKRTDTSYGKRKELGAKTPRRRRRSPKAAA
jgi:hypothetical protein